MSVDQINAYGNAAPEIERLPDPAAGVRCWAMSLDDAQGRATRLESALSEAELARAGRYGTPELRARYVVGRATLRRVLGELLGLSPARVPLRRGRRGRPELEASATLDFNVSHTRTLAIVGVVERGRIGVDVEHEERETRADALARKFLTDRERLAMATLDDEGRRRHFLRAWTCKEAMSKATGDALSAPLRHLDVELGDEFRLLAGPAPYDPARWMLFRVVAPSGYLATVAWWDAVQRND